MSRREILKFTKSHGIGNDMIIINGIEEKFKPNSEIVKKLCDRRFGIGADQLLLLLNSKKADFKIRIFNRDGGEAEMCGNGMRCIAKYIIDRGLSRKKELTIETLAGNIKIWANKNLYTVKLNKPILEAEQIPVNLNGLVINREFTVDNVKFKITCVNIGNPHCVIFVDDLKNFPVRTYGPLIEKHSLFPAKINVEFVKVVNENTINVRVWERGAGETLACGSGACAAVVASVLNRKTEREVQVRLVGGNLSVKWDKDDYLYLIGPAVEVYEGYINLRSGNL